MPSRDHSAALAVLTLIALAAMWLARGLSTGSVETAAMSDTKHRIRVGGAVSAWHSW